MIKRENRRGFCMLGFVSVKELKEEQCLAIKAFVNGRDVLSAYQFWRIAVLCKFTYGSYQ